MLYSTNLITKPNKESYNVAVSQLNNQTQKRIDYLKEKYESNKAAYDNYLIVKQNLENSVKQLDTLVNCLHDLVYNTSFRSLRR